MNDEEMQKLQNEISEGVEEYFESYDWDAAFKRYLEGK
jgi:hypothetical protein